MASPLWQNDNEMINELKLFNLAAASAVMNAKILFLTHTVTETSAEF